MDEPFNCVARTSPRARGEVERSEGEGALPQV